MSTTTSSSALTGRDSPQMMDASQSTKAIIMDSSPPASNLATVIVNPATATADDPSTVVGIAEAAFNAASSSSIQNLPSTDGDASVAKSAKSDEGRHERTTNSRTNSWMKNAAVAMTSRSRSTTSVGSALELGSRTGSRKSARSGSRGRFSTTNTNNSSSKHMSSDAKAAFGAALTDKISGHTRQPSHVSTYSTFSITTEAATCGSATMATGGNMAGVDETREEEEVHTEEKTARDDDGVEAGEMEREGAEGSAAPSSKEGEVRQPAEETSVAAQSKSDEQSEEANEKSVATGMQTDASVWGSVNDHKKKNEQEDDDKAVAEDTTSSKAGGSKTDDASVTPSVAGSKASATGSKASTKDIDLKLLAFTHELKRMNTEQLIRDASLEIKRATLGSSTRERSLMEDLGSLLENSMHNLFMEEEEEGLLGEEPALSMVGSVVVDDTSVEVVCATTSVEIGSENGSIKDDEAEKEGDDTKKKDGKGSDDDIASEKTDDNSTTAAQVPSTQVQAKIHALIKDLKLPLQKELKLLAKYEGREDHLIEHLKRMLEGKEEEDEEEDVASIEVTKSDLDSSIATAEEKTHSSSTASVAGSMAPKSDKKEDDKEEEMTNKNAEEDAPVPAAAEDKPAVAKSSVKKSLTIDTKQDEKEATPLAPVQEQKQATHSISKPTTTNNKPRRRIKSLSMKKLHMGKLTMKHHHHNKVDTTTSTPKAAATAVASMKIDADAGTPKAANTAAARFASPTNATAASAAVASPPKNTGRKGRIGGIKSLRKHRTVGFAKNNKQQDLQPSKGPKPTNLMSKAKSSMRFGSRKNNRTKANTNKAAHKAAHKINASNVPAAGLKKKNDKKKEEDINKVAAVSAAKIDKKEEESKAKKEEEKVVSPPPKKKDERPNQEEENDAVSCNDTIDDSDTQTVEVELGNSNEETSAAENNQMEKKEADDQKKKGTESKSQMTDKSSKSNKSNKSAASLTFRQFFLEKKAQDKGSNAIVDSVVVPSQVSKKEDDGDLDETKEEKALAQGDDAKEETSTTDDAVSNNDGNAVEDTGDEKNKGAHHDQEEATKANDALAEEPKDASLSAEQKEETSEKKKEKNVVPTLSSSRNMRASNVSPTPSHVSMASAASEVEMVVTADDNVDVQVVETPSEAPLSAEEESDKRANDGLESAGQQQLQTDDLSQPQMEEEQPEKANDELETAVGQQPQTEEHPPQEEVEKAPIASGPVLMGTASKADEEPSSHKSPGQDIMPKSKEELMLKNDHSCEEGNIELHANFIKTRRGSSMLKSAKPRCATPELLDEEDDVSYGELSATPEESFPMIKLADTEAPSKRSKRGKKKRKKKGAIKAEEEPVTVPDTNKVETAPSALPSVVEQGQQQDSTQEEKEVVVEEEKPSGKKKRTKTLSMKKLFMGKGLKKAQKETIEPENKDEKVTTVMKVGVLPKRIRSLPIKRESPTLSRFSRESPFVANEPTPSTPSTENESEGSQEKGSDNQGKKKTLEAAPSESKSTTIEAIVATSASITTHSQGKKAEARKDAGKIRLEKSLQRLKEKQSSATAKREIAKKKKADREAIEEELSRLLASIKREKNKSDYGSEKQKQRLQEKEHAAQKKKSKLAKAEADEDRAEKRAERAEAEAYTAREEAKMLLEELQAVKAKVKKLSKSEKKKSSRASPAISELDVKGNEDQTLVSELTNQLPDAASDVTDGNMGYGVAWDERKGLNMRCGDGGFEESVSAFLCCFMGGEEEDEDGYIMEDGDDDSSYGQRRRKHRSLVM